MDINNTILRGYQYNHNVAEAGRHQIYRVYVDHAGLGAGTDDFDTGVNVPPREIVYEEGVFNIFVKGPPHMGTVPAGLHYFDVFPTNGNFATNKYEGLQDHRDDLLGVNTNNSIRQLVPVYPKGPSQPNFVEFRIPGAIDTVELSQ